MEKHELAHLPTMDKVCAALNNLKCEKAAGASNTYPFRDAETTCRNPEFEELVLNLLHEVWKEKRDPKEWADKTSVPIPKRMTSLHAIIGKGSLFWTWWERLQQGLSS